MGQKKVKDRHGTRDIRPGKYDGLSRILPVRGAYRGCRLEEFGILRELLPRGLFWVVGDPYQRAARLYMGGCQHGPFLGPLNTRCRIILRTQKGTMILSTTHLRSFDHGSFWGLESHGPQPQNRQAAHSREHSLQGIQWNMDVAVSMNWGCLCGCPDNESHTIWDLYRGPLIFGHSHVAPFKLSPSGDIGPC